MAYEHNDFDPEPSIIGNDDSNQKLPINGSLLFSGEAVKRNQKDDSTPNVNSTDIHQIPEYLFYDDSDQVLYEQMNIRHEKGKKSGNTGMVIGIISLVLMSCVGCCCCFGKFPFMCIPGLLSVVGLIFSIRGIRLTKDLAADPKSITGTVLNALAILALILYGGWLIFDLIQSAGPSITFNNHPTPTVVPTPTP